MTTVTVACDTCAAAGNIGLQMALCGVVGGVILVKLAAHDLLDKVRREPSSDRGDPEAEARRDGSAQPPPDSSSFPVSPAPKEARE